ncbi:hypothetical protein CK203_062771 [Vitis vinifera]|uniref:Uncharacterized protein n=1 Tax=Vitis vinifera TaxID=29760 RepID=A0A438GB78_VITVI|nr:hypothetical protein CK203_062771 [Vitis vinifera]
MRNFRICWSSWLPKAISSSFQLQIVQGLKRWNLDFQSFEMHFWVVIRWIGPFIIHRVWSNGVVELLNSNGKDSFRVNGYRLKPFMESFKSEKEAINLLEPQKA